MLVRLRALPCDGQRASLPIDCCGEQIAHIEADGTGRRQRVRRIRNSLLDAPISPRYAGRTFGARALFRASVGQVSTKVDDVLARADEPAVDEDLVFQIQCPQMARRGEGECAQACWIVNGPQLCPREW